MLMSESWAFVADDKDDSKDDLSSLTEKANIDSLRLSKFIQRAAQVGYQMIVHVSIFFFCVGH